MLSDLVEAQHNQARERGQPVGRLLEQVAVHEAALRRQRVQADQRGHRRPLGRQRHLTDQLEPVGLDRSESTRLNSSHLRISYAVFCLKKKKFF